MFPISAGAYYPLEEVTTGRLVASVKIELRYFYYIALCYIDIVPLLLLYWRISLL
jgi:hypothetical protein